MFENFGTAIVQALGFFGVFGFFVYRLLSEKFSSESLKENPKKNSSKPVKNFRTEKKGLFGRKNKVEQNIVVNKKENKKPWFKRLNRD
tara:strand:- start:135 stop:398 length:264 start_codon:yes stop_codon:yes gene_type:complete